MLDREGDSTLLGAYALARICNTDWISFLNRLGWKLEAHYPAWVPYYYAMAQVTKWAGGDLPLFPQELEALFPHNLWLLIVQSSTLFYNASLCAYL